MSKFNQSFLVISFIFVFQACSTYTHDPDTKPDHLGTIFKPQDTTPITLINFYKEELEFETGSFGFNIEGDYKQITDAVITRMKREFDRNKIKTAENSMKIITVKVHNIRLVNGAISSEMYASVEATFSDGEKALAMGHKRLYWGDLDVNFDALIAGTTGELMHRKAFIAFVNN